MDNHHEISTLEDAIACLKRNFTEEDGLISQIEKGMVINNVQVQLIKSSLHLLQESWENRDLVPKNVIRLLWNVLPRIEHCIQIQPDREFEIRDLISKLDMWLDMVFTTPGMMSEEHAIAMVSQHVIGPSFFIDLLHSGTINENALDELLFALDTLSLVWSKKENVSKLAAGALIGIQGIFEKAFELYPETEKQRLNSLKTNLFERITNCL